MTTSRELLASMADLETTWPLSLALVWVAWRDPAIVREMALGYQRISATLLLIKLRRDGANEAFHQAIDLEEAAKVQDRLTQQWLEEHWRPITRVLWTALELGDIGADVLGAPISRSAWPYLRVDHADTQKVLVAEPPLRDIDAELDWPEIVHLSAGISLRADDASLPVRVSAADLLKAFPPPGLKSGNPNAAGGSKAARMRAKRWAAKWLVSEYMEKNPGHQTHDQDELYEIAKTLCPEPLTKNDFRRGKESAWAMAVSGGEVKYHKWTSGGTSPKRASSSSG